MHQQNSAWTKSIHKELKDLKEWKKQMEDMIRENHLNKRASSSQVYFLNYIY